MAFSRLFRVAAFVALSLAIAGCSTTSQTSGVNDPFEQTNRSIHAFNKGVDTYVVRPVSQAYDFVTPGLVRLLVSNALSHLELPRDFANNVLAGRWEPAGLTLARFGINTIVGAGGLLDPATDVGIPKQSATFDTTLGTYGAGEGPYYEIPLLGPSNIRDTVGRVVDIAFAPTTYLGAGPIAGATVTGLQIAEARDDNLTAIDNLLYESPDSYIATRTFFLQSQRAQLSALNGAPQDGEEDEDIELILD